MYDATYLYALAVNETLASSKSIRNGLEVAKRMYNRLYEGTNDTDIFQIWKEQAQPIRRPRHKRVARNGVQ